MSCTKDSIRTTFFEFQAQWEPAIIEEIFEMEYITEKTQYIKILITEITKNVGHVLEEIELGEELDRFSSQEYFIPI